MLNAFSTGLAGIRAHQVLLDVVGNNLANVNTPGFWGSRVAFSDLLSQTLAPGIAPGENRGGVNPSQVGTGVFPQSIDKITNQGAISATGRSFDLAIEGAGFFVVNDGARDLYTRVGTFGFDSENFLVDTRTGFRVQSALQDSIQIDSGTTSPAQSTANITLGGNLPATVEGPLAEVLTTSSAFLENVAAEAAGTAVEPFAFAGTEDFTISVDGGAPQTITLSPASTTAALVAAEISGQLTGATAIEDPDNPGAVLIQSTSLGTDADLTILDGTGTPAATLGFAVGTTITGSQVAATATTALNALASNSAAYIDDDLIEITGFDTDGTAVSGSFKYGVDVDDDGTTLGDLLAAIDATFPGATSVIEADGSITLTADEDGESNLSLSLKDAATTTGSTTFSDHFFTETQEGTGPDQVTTQVDIFDTLGRAHTLTLTFERQQSNTWDLSIGLDNGGTIVDNVINGIEFDENGKIRGIADDSSSIEIDFDDLDIDQTIAFDLGDQGDFTQFGDQSNLFVNDQDGYTSGSLTSLSVGANGTIFGVFSNGQITEVDQIGLVNFANPEGLSRTGNSLFELGVNSGGATRAQEGQPGTGNIVSGALEGSNVDITREFVTLILAQRGFQINSRAINTANSVLQEALNLIQ